MQNIWGQFLQEGPDCAIFMLVDPIQLHNPRMLNGQLENEEQPPACRQWRSLRYTQLFCACSLGSQQHNST